MVPFQLSGSVFNLLNDPKFWLARADHFKVVGIILIGKFRKQIAGGASFQFLAGQTNVAANLLVYAKDVVVRVFVPDLGWHQVKNGFEFILLLLQRALGLFALGHITQNGLYGRLPLKVYGNSDDFGINNFMV